MFVSDYGLAAAAADCYFDSAGCLHKRAILKLGDGQIGRAHV